MLDGGTDYAPCTCMVGVHHGDRVLAHVVNHKIVVFANITAPTTDDAQALVAIDRADTAAEAADKAGIAAASAQGSADKAATAAGRAQQSADDAATAAQTAWDHADDAATAASAAQSSADDAADAAAEADRKAVDAGNAAAAAQADATRANAAANSALIQASIVEDVAGTLRWIQEHGTYVATTDTTVQEGTVYFELKDGDYVPIVEPTGNPKAQGWYVLDITDAQSDYIMAHLAVTSAGLWVLPSGLGSATGPQTAPGYKVLLASDSMKLYDATGRIVTTYGESITFDSSRPQRIGNDTAYVEYYDSDNDGIPDSIRIVGTNLNTEISNFRQTVSETYATKSEAKQTDSDSGKREIVTEDAAELPLLTLTAYGECEQDGTPTPDNPVPVQTVTSAAIGVYDASGTLVTSTPIDLQGHELASLPDGTSDELAINAAGVVSITQRVGVVVFDGSGDEGWGISGNKKRAYTRALQNLLAPNLQPLTAIMCDKLAIASETQTYNGRVAYGISANVSVATTSQQYGLVGLRCGLTEPYTVAAVQAWLAENPLTVYYKLAAPQAIDLGYIDMPTTFDGGTVHVDAEIQPVIDASWWTKAGYESGKAYNDGSADLAALTERVTTAESSITQQAGQIALKANAADTYTKAQTDASLTLKANKATLTSEINASADTVKIDATRVSIEGAAIFTSGRLSQSSLDGAYDASGAASGAVNALKTDLASASGTTVINGGHIATDSLTVGHVSGLQGSLDGKASTGDVTTALNSAKAYTDAVEVGGRNLLLGTGKAKTSPALTPSSSGYAVWDTYSLYAPYSQVAKADEFITVSFDWSCTATGGNWHLECGKAAPWVWGTIVNAVGTRNATSNYVDVSSTNQSGHIAITFKVTSSQETAGDTFGWLRIRVDGTDWSGKTFTISKAKAEKGNRATDWTPAPEDVDAAVDDAAKTATNYISIDPVDGIRIADANPGSASTYQRQTSTSTEFFVDGESRLKVGGDGQRIGKEYVQGATDNESHMELDYHSMQMVDKDGNTFLHVSDLRAKDGLLHDYYTGDGNTVEFLLSLAASNSAYPVLVNGQAVTSGISKTTTSVTFDTPPTNGDEIEIRYSISVPSLAKAYTLGINRVGRIGGLSVATGSQTEASGTYSKASGYSTAATGYASSAEGLQTTASAEQAHAEGFQTTASREQAHAEGFRTTASGRQAHAEGVTTTASGSHSHAEGYQATASGYASHAQNYHTIAASDGQTAMGKYNVEDTNGDYALIVGNGTADDARSNAQAIRWNGLTDVAGRTAYPLFVYSTAPDEADLPVTPCFVLATSDYGLWYYDGQ